ERERDRLQSQRIELEKTLASYREKEESYTLTKKEATRKAAREAEELLAQTRREIEDTVRLIREGGAKRENIREARQRMEKAAEEVRKQASPEAAFAPLASVKKGERVSLSPTGSPSGTVVEVHRKDAVVDIGGKRVR